MKALIGLNSSAYEPKQWHGTLLVIAAVSFAIAFNVLLAKHLPVVQSMLLLFHILGLFAVVIPLLVMAPKKNGGEALVEIFNGGGWISDGSALMIGILTPLSSMLGYDCAVHMCKPNGFRVHLISRDIKLTSRQRRKFATLLPHFQEQFSGP